MKYIALSLAFVPILLVSAALRGDVVVQSVDPVGGAVEPTDPVVDDLVASPDVDELSLSNAVAIAAAAARAAEEVRVAAAAEERARNIAPQKEEVSFEDFGRMDIRTATVLEAERVRQTQREEGGKE